MQGASCENNQASAYYYSGPVFDVKKKFPEQVIAQQRNHPQPKGPS